MTCQLTKEEIDRTVSFHGHWCPGLASGIRAAEWALSELGSRSEDEELVAVVETDMCGVDAIQYLTGCTFGKGNLLYRDYGKNAFAFYRRSDGKAARLVMRQLGRESERDELTVLHRKQQQAGLSPQEDDRRHELRGQIAAWLMEAPLGDIFDVKPVNEPLPQKARILASLTCDGCGEAVMETRTRQFMGQTLCLPCFTRQTTQNDANNAA
jgi:formylmethanofuran dehydrogenase subunit E